MSSSSLLPNRHFDKLHVNRLKAQKTLTDNIQSISETPSYLFSAIFENATFTRDSTGGTLAFKLSEQNNNVIQFSDRPLRKYQNINIIQFLSLFTSSRANSFEKDPPNAVLTHSNKQKTYIVKLSKQDENSVIFNLKLLPGEIHDLTTLTGQMNFFVDSYDTSESVKQNFMNDAKKNFMNDAKKNNQGLLVYINNDPWKAYYRNNSSVVVRSSSLEENLLSFEGDINWILSSNDNGSTMSVNLTYGDYNYGEPAYLFNQPQSYNEENNNYNNYNYDTPSYNNNYTYDSNY